MDDESMNWMFLVSSNEEKSRGFVEFKCSFGGFEMVVTPSGRACSNEPHMMTEPFKANHANSYSLIYDPSPIGNTAAFSRDLLIAK
jgi:hypothetical protein